MTMRFEFLSFAGLTACWSNFDSDTAQAPGKPDSNDSAQDQVDDLDGDGFTTADGDCWDDPSTTPGAMEVVAGFDQPGAADVHPGAADPWYDGVDEDCAGDDDFDRDGDGSRSDSYPDTSGSLGDCDDGDAKIYVGAAEICNGVDDDCDGGTDTDAIDANAWYADADGDGYGDDATVLWDCGTISGRIGTGGDCGDDDTSVHPGAAERCDGQQNDCSSAWSAASENDLVNWVSGGVWTDVSSSFAAGGPGSPVEVSPSTAGTYMICSRTGDTPWYVGITSTVDLELVGIASTGTNPTVSRDATAGATLQVVDANVYAADLHLVGGLGESDGTYTYGGTFYGVDTAGGASFAWEFDRVVMEWGGAEIGGNVYVSGESTLTLTEATVEYGVSTVGAGGLRIAGSTVILTNSLVAYNYSEFGTGGAELQGGRVECAGAEGVEAGFIGNIGWESYEGGIRVDGGSLRSQVCDWVNDTFDVVGGGYVLTIAAYDESFSCSATAC